MISELTYLLLRPLISLLFKAYALPLVLRLVSIRNWFYVVITSDEGKMHSEEMLANMHGEIDDSRRKHDSDDVIAVRIFVQLLRGLPSDIALWAPFVPSLFIDRIVGWSETLRHRRIPTAMIVGVAILGPMNFSYFSGGSSLTTGSWLLVNSIGILITIILWKQKHPVAKRILHAWMGIAMAGSVVVLVWMTVHFQLYTSMTFKMLMLAMVALSPAIIVVDKSWRKRLFRGRWWLISLCWASIIAGSFIGSLLIAHDIKPLLEVWETVGLLAVGMVIAYGGLILASYILCWLGIRGSARGLRLVASGIRRLR